MNSTSVIMSAFEQGKGVFRLAPTWVPRVFCTPGRRLKLHPDDYYSLGTKRGGINERWFASTTPAQNGPLTGENEGLSQIVFDPDGAVQTGLLRDAVADLKGELIGEALWNGFHEWPMYSKFFDNKNPLPHHIHHGDKHAARVGQIGKPEAYYFPPQVNNHFGDFPYTFFGLEPGTMRDQVRQALMDFTKGDNKITNLSRAYRLEPGTGWDVPPGLLHAPGSLCTYEPQRSSDVFANWQSLFSDRLLDADDLWKDTPPEEKGNFDYLLEIIDWELNLDPEFMAHRFMRPIPAMPLNQTRIEGYEELWVCYRSDAFSAKELTILPDRTVTITDSEAYGFIVVQGHGTFGSWNIESPAMIRHGQLTNDEFFVSASAARAGVRISNRSSTDPLVMLKHFGPGDTGIGSLFVPQP